MIRTKPTFDENGKRHTEFIDQSSALPPDLLALVRFGMQSGLREFTTPTFDDDESRWDWIVRTWVTRGVDGNPRAFLVAQRADMQHFEVCGPDVTIGKQGSTMPNAVVELPMQTAQTAQTAPLVPSPTPLSTPLRKSGK